MILMTTKRLQSCVGANCRSAGRDTLSRGKWRGCHGMSRSLDSSNSREEAKLSELSQLTIGIALVLISLGTLVVCLPRKGKTARFVKTPFLAPAISVVMICELALGLILLAAYFTTIDNATLSGRLS